MPRRHTPKRINAPDVSCEELAASLTALRRINIRLGSARALITNLKSWSHAWPTDGTPITLLDVASGSADIPVAARTWAAQRGFDLRITAIDAHEDTLALAREHVRTELGDGDTGITLQCADARNLMELFAAQSFDYVHASLFLHTLPDIEVLTALRIMERLARRGIIITDLWRSPVTALNARSFTLRAPEHIKVDMRSSVEASFTMRDVRDICHRLEVPWWNVRWKPFRGCFTLAGERSGAWKL